ncbi:RTA1 like protein-domain-containing protein [Xylariaceae sp. FL0016]|nr:RTA1 like protein-domain-containing protein [Xylariaceae sp. FL0016]
MSLLLATVARSARLVERDGNTDGAETSSNCVTATPRPNGHVPVDACNSYYNYDPQFAPAVAVAVIFGLLTIVHVVEAFVFRKRYAWVVIMGGLWETIAFVLHSLGARDQQQIGYATAWQILFLLAPLWINAFVYMTFARLAWFIQPEKELCGIRPVSIAKYFVWADVMTFIVQAAGGIMASPGAGASIITIGVDIYLAGMGAQQFFIILFLCLMISFHKKAAPRHLDGVVPMESSNRRWARLLVALYIVLGLITIRIIYRIAEFAGGITPSNPVPFHEEYSYVLDCFPMMLALVTLSIWHPGRTLEGPTSELPRRSRAERKADKRERKAAKKTRKLEDKTLEDQSGDAQSDRIHEAGRRLDLESGRLERY